jgi:hypothetical protein
VRPDSSASTIRLNSSSLSFYGNAFCYTAVSIVIFRLHCCVTVKPIVTSSSIVMRTCCFHCYYVSLLCVTGESWHVAVYYLYYLYYGSFARCAQSECIMGWLCLSVSSSIRVFHLEKNRKDFDQIRNRLYTLQDCPKSLLYNSSTNMTCTEL